MEKIRLCIAGVTGWIGKPLARAVIKSVDFDLVGGVSRKNSGDDLGKILEIPGFSLTISESVSEALNKKTDVLIDYTSPDIVKSNDLMTARASGFPIQPWWIQETFNNADACNTKTKK